MLRVQELERQLFAGVDVRDAVHRAHAAAANQLSEAVALSDDRALGHGDHVRQSGLHHAPPRMAVDIAENENLQSKTSRSC